MRARLAAAAMAAMLAAGCGGGSTTQANVSTQAASSSPAASGSVHPASAPVLAARLKSAGLPVTHLIVYTPVTDPNHLMGRNGGYTSKTAWQDPRAEKAGAGKPASAADLGYVSYGGGIEVFPTAASAQARYESLRGFSPPFGDGYDFLAGTGILRLSQYLIPDQARAYKTAFATAVQQGST